MPCTGARGHCKPLRTVPVSSCSTKCLAAIRMPGTCWELEKIFVECHEVSSSPIYKLNTHKHTCSHTHILSDLITGLANNPPMNLRLDAHKSTAGTCHLCKLDAENMECMRMTTATLIHQEPGGLTFVASKISSKSIGRFLFCNHKA